MDSFLHEFLHILKMAFHTHLKVLLRISNVDFFRQSAGNFVDYNWHSTKTSVLTLAWSSASSAIAFPDLKIHRLDAFGEFFGQVSLKHLSHVWKTMIRHRDSQPFELKFISQFLENLVDRFFPQV